MAVAPVFRYSSRLLVCLCVLLGASGESRAASLYVGASGNIYELDPTTGSERLISLIDASTLAVSPTGNLYVGASGNVYESDLITGSERLISLIDASTLAVAVVPVPAAAWLFGGAVGALGLARRRTRPICATASPSPRRSAPAAPAAAPYP